MALPRRSFVRPLVKTPVNTFRIVLPGLLFAAWLSACNPATSDPQTTSSNQQARAAGAASTPAPAPVCANCGVITNIETMKVEGKGSGLGVVVGAVAGAVVGRQIGDGRGQDAATVAGAVGGGFAGNEIEKRVKGTTYFHITVAMDAGGTRTLDVDALNGVTTGTRVNVVGNNLQIASN